MYDIAVIIKKNIEVSIINNRNFYIKSILNYGLNIFENHILILEYSTDIQCFYNNIDIISDYLLNTTMDKRTLYIYIENQSSDILDDTYISTYFYTVLHMFNIKNIFIQYAKALIFREPIFKYKIYSNTNIITVDVSKNNLDFICPMIIIDNLSIDSLLLNIIDFIDADIDFFSFILNNITCIVYSSIPITQNTYIFKKDILNNHFTIFKCDRNLIVKNCLESIYELNIINNIV